MKKFEITEEVANAILQYLATKPYNEVAVLITELQKIQPIEEKATEEKVAK
jgi:hypothetical protein